jgi:selenoprotein W-related protein
VKGLTLVPASGGCFELTVNGELLYSKLGTGQFPDEQALLQTVRERLSK